MKRTFLLLTLSVLGLSASAQWSQNKTLEGGAVNAIAKHKTSLLIATDGGVFKSDDNATTWKWSGKGLESIAIAGLSTEAIASNDTVIYAATNGLRKSTDNGATWTAVTVPAGAEVADITFLKNKPYFLVNVTTGQATVTDLFKLNANGNALTKINGVAAANGATIFKNDTAIFVAYTNNIKYTTDGLGFKNFSKTGLVNNADFASIASDGSNLFVVQNQDSVYKFTSPSGWALQNSGLPATEAFANLKGLGTTLYINTFNQATGAASIYTTTNGGLIWTKAAATSPADLTIFDAKTINGVNYFGFDQGIYTTTNGTSFTAKVKGLLAANILATISNGTDILTMNETVGVLKSTDAGKTFSTFNTGITSTVGYTYLYKGITKLYALLNGTVGADLYSIDKAGTSWSKVTNPTYGAFNLFMGNSGDVLFMISANGQQDFKTFRSENNGTSWEEVTLSAEQSAVFFVYGDGDKTFFSGFNPTFSGPIITLSEDLGDTYTSNFIGIDPATVLITAFVSDSSSYLLADDGSLYLEDAGTWSPVSASGLGAVTITDIVDNGIYTYASTSNGIFYSTDKGESFKTFVVDTLYKGIALPLVQGFFGDGNNSRSIAISGDKIVLGTDGNGVWTNAKVPVVNSVNSKSNAIAIGLYPNPTNALVNVSTLLTEKSNVNVAITNILGKNVFTKSFNNQNKGAFNTNLDLSLLNAGNYFVTISTNNGTATEKVSIVK